MQPTVCTGSARDPAGSQGCLCWRMNRPCPEHNAVLPLATTREEGNIQIPEMTSSASPFPPTFSESILYRNKFHICFSIFQDINKTDPWLFIAKEFMHIPHFILLSFCVFAKQAGILYIRNIRRRKDTTVFEKCRLKGGWLGPKGLDTVPLVYPSFLSRLWRPCNIFYEQISRFLDIG